MEQTETCLTIFLSQSDVWEVLNNYKSYALFNTLALLNYFLSRVEERNVEI